MKKILILLILLVMAAITAASFAVRQAPEWLRVALEGALGKSVSIRAIDFQFPTTFVLSGVRIAEKDGPFAGEPEFSAETVKLTAVPTSLRGSHLEIDEIEVHDASVAVRRFGGKLFHAFSRTGPPVPAAAPGPAAAASGGPRTLTVGSLRLENGSFRFADFDTGPQGFAFEAEAVEARIEGFRVPASDRKSVYAVKGRLLQGREEKPAPFHISGSTAFSSLDTDVRAEVRDLHLTYFAPYFSKITDAAIEEGYLDARARAVVQARDLTLNADLAFKSLYFGALEGGGLLFGLSAKEILEFLKDSSGRLHIPVSLRWNFGRHDGRLRDAVRRSVEESLKRTVFGNVGSILEKAILKIGEKGLDAPEKTSETLLKKIKDFLKY